MAGSENLKEHVEMASQKLHFEEAFGLVYREYLKKGYCSENPSQMRITLYNTLPQSVTFCLWKGKTILATASLIIDSPLGLPMEDIYPEEVQNLRNQGRKLAEVSLLALNSEAIPKGLKPIYFAERLRRLYHVFKPLFWYARKTAACTDMCIAMNPIHKSLYSSLYFEQFGEERVYESANKNPSIAMRLSFDQIEDRAKHKTPGLFKLFLGNSLDLKPAAELFRWNAPDFHYFFCEKSEVLRKAKPQHIQYLSGLYPELPIAQWAVQETSEQNDGSAILRKCS